MSLDSRLSSWLTFLDRLSACLPGTFLRRGRDLPRDMVFLAVLFQLGNSVLRLFGLRDGGRGDLRQRKDRQQRQYNFLHDILSCVRPNERAPPRFAYCGGYWTKDATDRRFVPRPPALANKARQILKMNETRRGMKGT